jgi:hypothetical protein
MITRIFFSYSYLSDVKSLPGFVKGGRDKVPKEFNDYSQKQIANWADKEIKENVDAVATKSKNHLDISARKFKSPSYDLGLGSFDCEYFKYNFTVHQLEDDPSKCVFTGLLEIESTESFNLIEDEIDRCFEYKFDKAVSTFPKGEGESDFKELIYTLDDNKKTLNAVFEFSYENDFSQFQLVHKKARTQITVNESALEINFKSSESLASMLEVLKDLNKKIFSPVMNEGLLLLES